MSAALPARKPRAPQRGYALLLVLFVMTLMLFATMAASPVLYTQIQREREQETIWRGKQYARAVKLFYRKNGRFPSSMEDLSKPKLNVRFLRQPYTDPLNAKDGSWRLIYVGPGGQLIGSRKRNRGPLQMPSAAGMAPAGTPPAPPPPKDNKDSGNQNGDSSGTSEGKGPVFGGSIIGVGSKVNKPSIIVYEDGRKYIDWEFIWDPSKDAIGVGQPGMQTGVPAGQPAPFGGPPPGNPPGNPPGIPPLSNPPLQ